MRDMDDNERPRLIGLYSSEARSGKGTVAKILVDEFGYEQHQFSAPIKSAWAGLLEAAGCGGLLERSLEGDLKEAPIPALGGLSFRVFAEHLGNGLRERVGPDIWLCISRGVIESALKGGPVVVSDMRYPNEFALIKTLGGICVRVERADGYTRGFQHPSEGRLNHHSFDYAIRASSPEELVRRTRAMLTP
jgi:hypothetical protein